MSKVPGIQYPSHLDENNPTDAAIRNIIDNLFYLRRLAENPLAVPGAASQVQQIVKNISFPAGAPPQSSDLPIVGTHLTRLTLYEGANLPLGTLYFEYDRSTTYIIANNGSGQNAWYWEGGAMEGTLANIPTDLGTNDTGFVFVTTDASQHTQYTWNGTAFITTGGYLQEVDDAVNAAVTTVMRLVHSAPAPAQSMGIGIDYRMPDSGTTLRQAALDSVEWFNVATTSVFRRWWLRVAGVLTDLMDLDPTGTLTIVGNYVLKSGTAFAGTFSHTNTVNRSYSLPDADGAIPYATTTLTSGNLLIGGGGVQVSDSSIALPGSLFSGTVALAKITGGGSDGSLTAVNGFITAYTAPT